MAIYVLGNPRETDDLSLAAGLLRMGINLDPKLPFRVYERERGGAKYVFCFQPRSACGRFETEDLVKVWNDEGWMKSHPNHPWAVLRGGMVYLEELKRIVHRAVPLAEVQKEGLQGFLAMNADDATQERFFRRMREVARRRRRY